MIKDAMFWEKRGEKVRCLLCPHNCVIGEGQYGLCSVRTNMKGTLKTINYGEVTAAALDPIEKKPLHHFYPGSYIFSVGTFGCNFSCGFCQNYTIAHYRAKSIYISPEELEKKCSSIDGSIGIAFTYNEPLIWYEYVYDTAKFIKENHKDFKVVLVTNGYIEKEPLFQLLPYVDAMNIDLKSFSEDTYKKICGGELKNVLRTIETCYDKCHIEITTLLVSGVNDSLGEVEDIASFLASLDKNIPLHLTRYFPNYKFINPPTDIDFMKKAKEVASKYLNNVRLGNV